MDRDLQKIYEFDVWKRDYVKKEKKEMQEKWQEEQDAEAMDNVDDLWNMINNSLWECDTDIFDSHAGLLMFHSKYSQKVEDKLSEAYNLMSEALDIIEQIGVMLGGE